MEQRDERELRNLRTYNLCCRLSLLFFFFGWEFVSINFPPSHISQLLQESKLMANLWYLFLLHSSFLYLEWGVKDFAGICERYLDFVWIVFHSFFCSFHLHFICRLNLHALSRQLQQQMMKIWWRADEKQLLTRDECVWCRIHEQLCIVWSWLGIVLLEYDEMCFSVGS